MSEIKLLFTKILSPLYTHTHMLQASADLVLYILQYSPHCVNKGHTHKVLVQTFSLSALFSAKRLGVMFNYISQSSLKWTSLAFVSS